MTVLPTLAATLSWPWRKGRFTRRILLPAAVFLWPLVYFYRHCFVIHGSYAALSYDLIPCYYSYKVYLLAHLAAFRFPLWSPSEGAGFPFYSNPNPQSFYPFNIPLALWYRLAGGYGPVDQQIYTVLGACLFALGLYYWLKTIHGNTRAIVFAVFVMSVSFRIAEALRFSNAIHAAAWYPWILYSLTKILLSRGAREAAAHGLLLFVFLYLLLTAGYPYYVYYSPCLFLPYFAICAIKPLRRVLIGAGSVQWGRALGTMTVACGAVLLLCSPYLLAIKRLLAETVNRGGKSFAYSTAYPCEFKDTIGSLVYPPLANWEGVYFFSITAFLILAAYILGGGAARRNEAGKDGDRAPTALFHLAPDCLAKLVLLLWIAVISYITYGEDSYLFVLLWKYCPGFSSLRAWGRLNITLIPILAWFLTLAYDSFEASISREGRASRERRWPAAGVALPLGIAYAAALAVQYYCYSRKIHDRYWVQFAPEWGMASRDVWFLYLGAVAFVVLLGVVVAAKRIRLGSTRSLTAVLAILLCMAIIEMRPVGTRFWIRTAKWGNSRAHLDVKGMQERLLSRPRRDDWGMVPTDESARVGTMPNWYFDRYNKFLTRTANEEEKRRVLLGVKDGRRLFFSEAITYDTIAEFLRDALRYRDTGNVLSYTGDELTLRINAPRDGFLSFIDNWNDQWRLYVDGKAQKIDLLFGTFKSAALNAGEHEVRFAYEPGLF